jgi:15-cis-phytoene synthase
MKSNFALGIMLLPRAKRRALSALYAFAREVDDLADRPDPDRTALERMHAAVLALPEPSGRPCVDAVGRYGIPSRSLADLVDGALMDCERTRYGTWDELREYCRRVAGAVGVACLAVFQPDERARAEPLAETLGIALQQINIMRDVPEDWQLGRVYLPSDERKRFGVGEDDIAAGRVGPEWRALMEHQARRGETLLEEGLALLPLLDRRSAMCVRSFAGIYRGLLQQMKVRGYDVFQERPRVSALAKARSVAAL